MLQKARPKLYFTDNQAQQQGLELLTDHFSGRISWSGCSKEGTYSLARLSYICKGDLKKENNV
jgi:hypothetical protein